MNEPKISVIVPIYNVAPYLRKCLDSIVGQIFSELEIILINDGSTDDSSAIIEEYAKRDKRIVVIDKPNEGYGKTMNRGLDTAKGKYVGIVESDDWIESDMYEALYGIADLHNVDVVKGRYIPFDDKTGIDENVSEFPISNVECIINPRKNPSIFLGDSSIWSGLYKREFLEKNEIRFLESPGASYQDTGFGLKVWAMADRAFLTKKPVLHYRTGHLGQSAKSKEKVFCVCDEFKEVERYLIDKAPDRFRKLEKILNRKKFLTYKWNYNRLEGENKKKFHQQMEMELKSALKRGAIDRTSMTSKEYLKFQRICAPESLSLRIKYFMLCISRVFIKDTRKGNSFQIRILFGSIKIAEYPIRFSGIDE